MTDIDAAIASIVEQFSGYHVDLQLFPAGGILEVSGCSECGTNDSIFIVSGWKQKRNETITTAIADAKNKLENKLAKGMKNEAT